MVKHLLKGQLLADNVSEVKGVVLSRSALESLLQQLPNSIFLNQEHDLTKPPAGRAFNFRLQDLPSGVTQIIADVEIWDEQLMINPGGLSLAFMAHDKSNSGNQEADIYILINPEVIPLEYAENILTESLNSDEYIIRLGKLQQWSADLTPIIILTFISYAIAQGFFGEIGAGLWHRLKGNLRDLTRKHTRSKNTDLIFHSTFSYLRNGNMVTVVVVFNDSVLELLQRQPVNLDEIKEGVEKLVGDSEIIKIVVRLTNDSPYWNLSQIVDSTGKLIDLE